MLLDLSAAICYMQFLIIGSVHISFCISIYGSNEGIVNFISLKMNYFKPFKCNKINQGDLYMCGSVHSFTYSNRICTLSTRYENQLTFKSYFGDTKHSSPL